MKYFSKNQNGFTFIEIIVTIIVISIITAIGAQILTTIIRSFNLITLRKDMLFSSRVSMNRMIREIRHVDISRIIEANSTRFQAYIVTDANIENVRFELDGTNLKRNNDILANDIQNFTGIQFTYWDANEIITSDPNNISRVDIRLRFQKGNQTFDYESGVRIRNKK